MALNLKLQYGALVQLDIAPRSQQERMAQAFLVLSEASRINSRGGEFYAVPVYVRNGQVIPMGLHTLTQLHRGIVKNLEGDYTDVAEQFCANLIQAIDPPIKSGTHISDPKKNRSTYVPEPGDIFWVKHFPHGDGTAKSRPVMVVSAREFNKGGQSLCIPITSRNEKFNPDYCVSVDAAVMDNLPNVVPATQHRRGPDDSHACVNNVVALNLRAHDGIYIGQDTVALEDARKLARQQHEKKMTRVAESRNRLASSDPNRYKGLHDAHHDTKPSGRAVLTLKPRTVPHC